MKVASRTTVPNLFLQGLPKVESSCSTTSGIDRMQCDDLREGYVNQFHIIGRTPQAA